MESLVFCVRIANWFHFIPILSSRLHCPDSVPDFGTCGLDTTELMAIVMNPIPSSRFDRSLHFGLPPRYTASTFLGAKGRNPPVTCSDPVCNATPSSTNEYRLPEVPQLPGVTFRRPSSLILAEFLSNLARGMSCTSAPVTCNAFCYGADINPKPSCH